jgi:predicted O-methyltransferase YrrM
LLDCQQQSRKNSDVMFVKSFRALKLQFGRRQAARFLSRGPAFWREVASFDIEEFRADQVSRFQELGLDWGRAQTVIAGVPAEVGRRDASEHYSLFAAWLHLRPNSHVLEVGTETGQFSAFLSALVPDGRVVTIDLPTADPRYRNATAMNVYDANSRGALPGERARFLNRPNVRFFELNSLGLANSSRRFDAIWLDGDHTNPVVTLDVAQVIRLINPGGLLAMDDIRLPGTWYGKQGYDEAYQALEALQGAGVIKYRLIHKRVTEQHLILAERRKYIAVVQRLSDTEPLSE